MSKVDKFLELAKNYQPGSPPSKLKCTLARLYASMTPEEKAELKKRLGGDWSKPGELAGWYSGDARGKEWCDKHYPERKINWLLIAILVVVVLVLLIAFVIFKR